MFKDLPGYRYLTEKECEVIDDAAVSFIEDSDWVFRVRPGVRIAMSFFLMTMIETETTQKCPRCETLNAGAKPEKHFVKWYNYI